MNAIQLNTGSRAARRPAQLRRTRQGGVAAMALTALALLAAGCGSSSPSTGVAHLGSSTSSSTPSSTSSAESGSGGSGPAQAASQAVAYAACVRAHGVPNFPDPQVSSHGNEVSVRVAVTPGLSSNPHFNSAQQACRKLLPGGGPGSGSSHQISPQEQSQYLKAAACIRSHGVPNFADPTFSGGGVHIEKQGINLNSPQLLGAEQACKSLIPGGLHGGR
jgi:hypothetical protein